MAAETRSLGEELKWAAIEACRVRHATILEFWRGELLAHLRRQAEGGKTAVALSYESATASLAGRWSIHDIFKNAGADDASKTLRACVSGVSVEFQAHDIFFEWTRDAPADSFAAELKRIPMERNAAMREAIMEFWKDELPGVLRAQANKGKRHYALDYDDATGGFSKDELNRLFEGSGQSVKDALSACLPDVTCVLDETQMSFIW